ncbi:guanylate kinase [Melissococcus plutonius]|uniref:Guanylate kinase n=2 Tax=Melissococcus plutonius TaxID=33970 RepID=A0A2Z5Y1E7_9ENTE|nr:guanylate kinase [Melissococcus plutonius]BAL61761.1 guanylate kinase [Melissococcus plutonius DAT561]MCV2498292.1 guanylate kinase [Melissococcus plutonius]MCV2500843.1 guanylate kinase [Melissococcus plutonius]MCV2504597.1 guanylate kinase [Melissococcus plutonius]MCV2506907.1 guanylate kinase [Melissococcus plutonius]
MLKHFIFILIGPSGSGKTVVANNVFSNYKKVISHTTRAKRPKEENGIDYYFDSEKRFKQLMNQQAFAEYDCYHGNWYGTIFKDIVLKTNQHNAYAILTYSGFKNLSDRLGDKVIPVFFDVSKENVRIRLNYREKDQTIIQKRISTYEKEYANKQYLIKYPHIILLNANQPIKMVIKELKQKISFYR